MSKPSLLWARYKLRLRRKRLLLRAFRKRRELVSVSRKVGSIRPSDVLLFSTMRNEIQRLPYFLEHYRRLGIAHFLIVDNASDDGTGAYLASQPDVSVWRTTASYKASRFGMDWLTALLWRFGKNHWTITADADELFIYPQWEEHKLPALTHWLDNEGVDAVGATMIELYPKGPIAAQSYEPGQDPTEVLGWFDAYGYWVQRQPRMGNLWLQGGPRARCFFSDEPDKAPTLNKIPLIRWDRQFVYVSSTHNALPPRLNLTYDTATQTKFSGALLHTKFLPDASKRAVEEKERREHFADPERFEAYYNALEKSPDLWCETSVRYKGWQQLEAFGLISRGTFPKN